jgi:aarF domain-containing kinase
MSTKQALLKELENAYPDEAERAYAMQERMRKGLREVLGAEGEGEGKLPRELVFLARNLRIVQGNNQFLGSPVNRLKITAIWASRARASEPSRFRSPSSSIASSIWSRIQATYRHALFLAVLWASDAMWWVSRVRQVLGLGGGMEEDVEERLREVMRGFGVEMRHGLFEG